MHILGGQNTESVKCINSHEVSQSNNGRMKVLIPLNMDIQEATTEVITQKQEGENEDEDFEEESSSHDSSEESEEEEDG